MRQLIRNELQTGGLRLRPRIILYRTTAGFLADYDENLRRGGAFVNTRHALRVGASVRLTISLHRPALQATVEGRVDQVIPVGNGANEPPGMRVSFADSRPLAGLASQLRDQPAFG
jgi:uncharacterized protein (TIGR02266 family)